MVGHICFCADGNYIKFVPSVIESVLRSNSHSYIFHVISDAAKPADFEVGLRGLDPTINVLWHKSDMRQFEDLKVLRHITKGTYYRILIPELVNAETVLYLDCDVLVRKDLSELFEIDLGGNFIGAVTNPFFSRQEKLGLRSEAGYFNAGVMLINARGWRDHDIKGRVLAIIHEKENVLDLGDQDALNLAIGGRWKHLGATYNVQMVMFTRYQELFGEVPDIEMVLSSPAIVHFSATNKQWHYSCFLKYAIEYRALSCSIMAKKRSYLLDRLVGLYHRYYHKVWLQNSYV